MNSFIMSNNDFIKLLCYDLHQGGLNTGNRFGFDMINKLKTYSDHNNITYHEFKITDISKFHILLLQFPEYIEKISYE